MITDDVRARRAAIATIFVEVTTKVVDRVVTEAVRTSDFFGLRGAGGALYGAGIRAVMPLALDTFLEPDEAERDRKLGTLVVGVRAVSEEHHVPRLVERGLVSLAFGFAREVLRRRSTQTAFTFEQLEPELRAFQVAFEAKLYS